MMTTVNLMEGKPGTNISNGMMEIMEGHEVDMKVQRGDLADLTGMMGNGNGKILPVEIVIIIPAGAIILHRPLCWLGPHLMQDLFPRG